MECATKPPSKPSSNISDIVSKFAKVCRFRSVGVFSTENPRRPRLNNATLTGDSTDATKEGECDAEKVHPHQLEIQPQKTIQCADVEIMRLFDTISALKSAYVRLQEAHIPYDTDKIKAADELFVAQLESLCKIKRVYKEKQFNEVDSVSARSALLLAEIQVHEKLLEKLKFQLKVKDTEVINLQQQLLDLDLKNRELSENFRLKERENVKVGNLSSVEDVFKAASKAIHDFAKPLISLMKASGWDLDQAAESIEASVEYSKRSHKKYAFEAYIAQIMFSGMPLQSSSVDSILKWDDSFDGLIRDPHSNFAKFCRTKYLSVVHPMMEESFFGNLDHRKFVSGGIHPRTPFYQAFVKMAGSVWALLGVAALSKPKAQIYRVERGSKFSDVYMDSVEVFNDGMIIYDEGISRFKIEFMVMPGFRIGEMVLKSRVYLSGLRSSHHRF